MGSHVHGAAQSSWLQELTPSLHSQDDVLKASTGEALAYSQRMQQAKHTFSQELQVRAEPGTVSHLKGCGCNDFLPRGRVCRSAPWPHAGGWGQHQPWLSLKSLHLQAAAD